MKAHIYKYLGLFLAFSFFSATNVFSQESYLLKELRVPQILQENPGSYLPYDAHVAVPMAGRIQVGATIPFGIGALQSLDSKFLKNLSKNNVIGAWARVDALNIGFRVKKRNYFSITAAVKLDVNLAVQKDLFRLVMEGNHRPDNENLSLVKDNFLSINSYVEFGLGYNREINDNISFGINARYLSGLANAHAKRADLRIESGEDYHELLLYSDMLARVSGVFEIDVERDSDGNIIYDQDGKMTFKKMPPVSDMLHNLKNHGFAIDLGARYRINKYLEISGAVLDIGLINWKTHTKLYDVDNKPFTFEGLKTDGGEVLEMIDKNESIGEQFKEYFKEVKDSLANFFLTDLVDGPSYKKWLNTRFNLGVSFYATENDRFSATFNGIFVNGVFTPSGSISYRRTCKRWFDVVIGNTFKSNSILNPGAGVNFTLGVIQLYALVDYTNTLAYIDKAKNLNVVLGLNFIAHKKTDSFKPSYPY